MSEVTENPDKKATRLGLVVRRPKPHELFVDADSPAQRTAFREGLEELRAIEGEEVVSYVVSPSKTEGHVHIVVTFLDERRLAPYERLAYQILLGSDPKRELLAMKQVRADLSHDAVVFFEKPS